MSGQNNNMRLLISAFACEPGRGSEQEVGWKWALELSSSLDVTVLTQTRNRMGIERELAKGAAAGRRLRFEYVQLPESLYRMKSRFDCLTWPYYAAWQWLAMRRACKLHEETPFDLIHHLTFASFRVPIWMRQVGPPVVFGPVGGAECAPWRLLGYRASWKTWPREAFRNVMTRVNAFLLRMVPPIHQNRGICLAATPGMLEIFKSRNLPCRVFPTIGAGDGMRTSKRVRFDSDGCRFLYVGRLHVLKGVQFLLQAFADERLGRYSLTVVGGGPEEARLKRQAEELGLDTRVEWLGLRRREELQEIYAAHDVVVAPSMYESGGLVVLEAMEQGIPCIVLDVGGHAVSVTKECGVKVDASGSAEKVIADLADAMQGYAENKELRFRHGNHAAERVATEYAWDAKVKRMLEIYEKVADR
jgi:glycosyltransferase involved in cell wall biosynthesis